VKYSKDILVEAVAKSTSVADVLRHLGLRFGGGTHSHISGLLKKHQLDTSHFTGRGSNHGEDHRGGAERLSWKQVLVLKTSGFREKAFRLRRALIESGVEYKCSSCPLTSEWQGKPLRLQVEHKNGNFLDCRKSNLEFLCPNCHSQKETSGGAGLIELTSEATYQREYRKRRRGEMGDTLG
jgi:hypothetical protein